MCHNKVLSAELISGFWHNDDLVEKIEIIIALDTIDLKAGEPLHQVFQNLQDLLKERASLACPEKGCRQSDMKSCKDRKIVAYKG